MFNKFSSRIVLAWIVLGLAMILLTLSVSFAQSVSVIRKDNGEVKFKYKSTDKKNSQDIDTTFTAKTDEEFHTIMKGINDRNNLNLSMLKEDDNDSDEIEHNSNHTFSYNIDVTTKDGKKTKSHCKQLKGDHADIHIEMSSSMKELEKEMKELEASIANMKFDMNVSDEEKEMDIRIHSNHPPMPPTPPSPPSAPSANNMKKERVEITVDKNGKQTKVIKKFDDNDLNIPDSLDNEDHVIVFGDKDEKAPELEKVITNENGKQIFIYKRKK